MRTKMPPRIKGVYQAWPDSVIGLVHLLAALGTPATPPHTTLQAWLQYPLHLTTIIECAAQSNRAQVVHFLRPLFKVRRFGKLLPSPRLFTRYYPVFFSMAGPLLNENVFRNSLFKESIKSTVDDGRNWFIRRSECHRSASIHRRNSIITLLPFKLKRSTVKSIKISFNNPPVISIFFLF